MVSDLREQARWAHRTLRALGDPERRGANEWYCPTRMEMLGVSAPKMRTVLRELLQQLKGEEPHRILELARLLRDTGTHEARQVGYELLDRRPDARRLLGPRTARELGKGNDNWASVDAFSGFVSGPLWREGRLPDRTILFWARSSDHWWRRTALVSTVALNLKSRGGTGDPERTLLVCRRLVGDPEPMVAKGLSWALRGLVPVDPVAVADFLHTHDDLLPSLVKREVTNKLKTGKKNP